jgi:hypothetical protein
LNDDPLTYVLAVATAFNYNGYGYILTLVRERVDAFVGGHDLIRLYRICFVDKAAERFTQAHWNLISDKLCNDFILVIGTFPCLF